MFVLIRVEFLNGLTVWSLFGSLFVYLPFQLRFLLGAYRASEVFVNFGCDFLLQA